MFRSAVGVAGRVLSLSSQNIVVKSVIRCYSAAPKRFYKNAGILNCDGKFEITLDNKKLRTPSGGNFYVTSEPLAIAVAAEWDSQKETIERSRMHLTTLCNTVLDNPSRVMKMDIVSYLLTYLPTDTVLYYSPHDEELYKYQMAEWYPILEWFNERFDADVEKCDDITQPTISPKTKMNISKQLMSYNDAAMQGIMYATDTLKSVVLTLACVEKRISVEKAVALSRLEEEFQLKFWQRIEWAHDLAQQDNQARLAASILFIHFNSFEHIVTEKMKV